MKISGSGSISQGHGSSDPDLDPPPKCHGSATLLQAILNPEHKISFPREGVDPLLVDVLQSCLNRDPKARPSIRQDLFLSPSFRSH